MNITDGNTTYYLPLDYIDVNYTPITNITGNSTVPLWNVNSFGEKTHYEFQILASKKNIATEGKDIPKLYQVYKCKVCDLDVPKIFRKEHNSSSKHKLNLEILEQVLERAKNCMAFDGDDDNEELRRDREERAKGLYYCKSCSVIVKVENKKDHEKSKTHFKSFIVDKLLCDLLMLYVDKEYIEQIKFDYMSDADDEKSSMSGKGYDFNWNNICEMDSLSDNSDTSHFNETDENIEFLVPKPTLSLKDYISMVNERSNGANKLTVDGNNIKIVTMDNSVVTISEQNFHSFYELNDYTICGTCQYVINDMDGDIENHKMCSDHIEKISEPLQDMHCIRTGAVGQYCVLCNRMVNITLEAHKKTKLHQDMLNKSCLKTNVLKPAENLNKSHENNVIQDIPASKKGRTYCFLCKLYIDTHNFNGHINGKFHKMNVLLLNETKVEEIKPKGPKKTLCVPCNIYIDTHNLKGHTEGKTHKDNCIINSNPTTSANHNGNVPNTASNPNVVKDEVKETKIHDHLILTDYPSTLHCIVCNANVPNIVANISEHVKGKTHRSNFKILTNNMHHHLKLIDDKVKCIICDVYVHLSNLNEHVQKSVVHKTKFTSLLESNSVIKHEGKFYCLACSISVQEPNLIEHLYNKLHMTRNSRVNYCFVCNVKVPDGKQNMTIHMNGRVHKRNVENLKQLIEAI